MELNLLTEPNYARSLIEATRDPMITINTKGKIMDMNEAMLKVTERTRSQLTNSNFFIYFKEKKMAQEICKKIFVKGFVKNYPLTLIDGEFTPVLFNGSVFKSASGKIKGAVMIGRTIKEQKEHEKDLIDAKMLAEVATISAERATKKAENATKNAIKATNFSKETLKAKQQFLSNMSHEIRTPLNAIIGFTKVVLKTKLDTKQMEFLSAIKSSSDSLIILINDILDLSKVNAGKMKFEKIPFKLSDSISNMLLLFEPRILEQNIVLISELDESIPLVLLGDPVRLNQIIMNLMSNSIKFTKNGKIIVTTKLLEEDEKMVTISISISDTGIGIAKDKLKSIFQIFEQARSSTSRIYGGTGLGLAIVKQLVESQGGGITVKSKLHKGSVFSFTLSFTKTNIQLDSTPIIMELDKEIKKVKILIVEDVILNQLLLKTLLDDFGFEYDIAGNGKIAIEKLKAQEFDIILMDLQMPVLNGLQATEYIRNTMNSKIPIIAITADVTEMDIDKCNSIGIDDYIAKPIDEHILYAKIIAFMKKAFVNNSNSKVVNPLLNNTQHLNIEKLKQLTKFKPKLFKEIIEAFLEQTPILIASIKDSFERKNWSILKASIHKIIPSLTIIGMSPEYETLAKSIYDYASKSQQENEISEMILKLESECSRACKELKEIQREIKL